MLITEKIIRQSFRYEKRNGFEANVLWMGKPLWNALLVELASSGLLKRAYSNAPIATTSNFFHGMEVRLLPGVGKVFYLGSTQLSRYPRYPRCAKAALWRRIADGIVDYIR